MHPQQQTTAVNVRIPGCCSTFGDKLPAVPFEWNLPFLQSVPGAFKIAHTVIGMICLIVIAHFSQLFHPLTGASLGLLCSKSSAFFLLVTYGFFVTSLILVVCCSFSYFTASFLPKTTFELAYHLTASLMYLTASLILLISVASDSPGTFKAPGYEADIAVSALGLINCILYGISAYFSYQARKQMG